jgi:hypothetical protein
MLPPLFEEELLRAIYRYEQDIAKENKACD